MARLTKPHLHTMSAARLQARSSSKVHNPTTEIHTPNIPMDFGPTNNGWDPGYPGPRSILHDEKPYFRESYTHPGESIEGYIYSPNVFTSLVLIFPAIGA